MRCDKYTNLINQVKNETDFYSESRRKLKNTFINLFFPVSQSQVKSNGHTTISRTIPIQIRIRFLAFVLFCVGLGSKPK